MHDMTVTMLVGLGGLALFLYGILLLSEGLKEASGNRFSQWITRLSKQRWKSYALGVAMGATVQSSASTVMTVGFINAGLLTLLGAIPLIAGANLGTSLAMQFIALDIEWLWPVAAFTGVIIRLWPGHIRRRRMGQALIGLALLFLGLRLMSQSVYPFRETLSYWLTSHDAGHGMAFFAALGGSLAFTMIVQSSSATMGILFSLATAGVFVDITHVFPLVIGAQIGTCITALISSIGTSSDARRGALAHLYFNLFSGGLAMICMPWMADLVHAIGMSPARQVANLHTVIMLTGGIIVVPLARGMEKLLRFTARFANRIQEQSFLDQQWVDQPQRALDAGDLELTRITRIARRGFILNRDLVNSPNRRTYHYVKHSEESIDLVYHTMRHYLMQVALHVHDQAETSRLQWMNMFLIYLERISDHNDNLADLTMELSAHVPPSDLPYARSVCDNLYRAVEPLLASLETAWIPGDISRSERARLIRAHRATYLPESEKSQTDIVARITSHELQAITGFFMTEYISEMDRIVRHTKKIAGLLEKSA